MNTPAYLNGETDNVFGLIDEIDLEILDAISKKQKAERKSELIIEKAIEAVKKEERRIEREAKQAERAAKDAAEREAAEKEQRVIEIIAKHVEKDFTFASMRDLIEEEKKLKRKMSKLKIPCSHTNEKGKIKVDFIKGTVARCKKCDCVFDFSRVNDDDIIDAVQIIHNVINQIKALCNDPEKESSLIRELGTIDFNLVETYELYKRTIERYSKVDNKNNHKDSSFGSYGASNIKFIDGKRNTY